MSHSQPELWNRIQHFLFDQPNTHLTFAKRLARENGWSLPYANRVLEEYKRFAYLACVSKQTITPSDEVDQAWHLHLTYTRSYWDIFCQQVLQRPLHHEPTRGGKEEDEKYLGCYNGTLALYEQEFGEKPPAGIWPDAATRFRYASGMKRVSGDRYWLLPKPELWKPAHIASLSLLSFSLAGCTVFGFKLTEKQLIIGGLLLLLLVVLIYLLTKVKRKGGGCGSSGGCGSGCGGDSGCGGGGCGGD